MESKPHPPLCDQCEGDHELTVKHILIECNFLKIICRRHYDVTYIYICMITHPCPNISSGFSKSPFKLGIKGPRKSSDIKLTV